jgi:hypothetical protein
MVQGGTGKAEDAKQQDAGISPKQCPGNERQKKEHVLDSVKIVQGTGNQDNAKRRSTL